MPYSCVSEGLDLVLTVLGIWKQLRTSVFIIPYNFCYNKIVKRHSLGCPFVNALLLAVRAAGPHPDGHGHFGTTEYGLLIINNKSPSVNLYQNCLPVPPDRKMYQMYQM